MNLIFIVWAASAGVSLYTSLMAIFTVVENTLLRR